MVALVVLVVALVVALVEAFFAAGAFLVVALVVFFGAAASSSFLVVLVVFLVAVFEAAGLAALAGSGFASFTGPEGPAGSMLASAMEARGSTELNARSRIWLHACNRVNDRSRSLIRHALYRSLGGLTLRAGEDTIVGTLGESTVEERGELRILDVAELVVDEDVFLEGLATMREHVR